MPVDLRLLRSRDLQIDESALTGESVPVEKKVIELKSDSLLAERVNMTTPVLLGLMLSVVMLVGAFGSFEWALGKSYSDAVARTVSVNVFVVVELFYLFNCRSLTKSMFQLGLFTNRWIGVGVGCMVANTPYGYIRLQYRGL